MRLDAAVASATSSLAEASESPRLDAELMLCRTIDVPRSYLYAHPDYVLDALAIERFQKLVKRRIDGEPVAYITGSKEFWSHELLVSPATLVPRPETELVVELALRELPRDSTARVLDLGTGSGAIAIAVAAERAFCQVTAADISAEALAVAKENVRRCNLSNVECVLSDWTSAVDAQQFDLILSNPPYVGRSDAALEALRHEPMQALASGEDGLQAMRILARDCAALLPRGGAIIVEHGATQAESVAGIFADQGWQEIACHEDLAGIPRVTVARRGGTQAPSFIEHESS